MMDPAYKNLVETVSLEIALLASQNTHLQDAEFMALVADTFGPPMASALFGKVYGCDPQTSVLQVGGPATNERIALAERMAARIIRTALLATHLPTN